MVKCHICGQPTVDGSVCRHCRAALNRLRERSAPADTRGVMALAGASTSGVATLGGATDTGFSSLLRRRKAPSAPPARTPAASASAIGSPLRVRLLPIGALAVVVALGALAVYQLVDSGSAPESAVSPRIGPAPVPDPVRILETGDAAPPAVAEAPAVRSREPAAVPPPPSLAQTPAPERWRTEPDASRRADAPRAARPVPPAAAAPSQEAASPVASAPVKPAPAATPVNPAAEIAPVASSPAPVAAANRWERMDAALDECARQGLFGRVICNEKVKLEYCAGQWGQSPRCPSNAPVVEHGG